MAVSESVLAAIRETNSVFCSEVAAKRHIDALDRVYTAGARVLPPGAAMISGREAAKVFWKSTFESLNVKSASLESGGECRWRRAA